MVTLKCIKKYGSAMISALQAAINAFAKHALKPVTRIKTQANMNAMTPDLEDLNVIAGIKINFRFLKHLPKFND